MQPFQCKTISGQSHTFAAILDNTQCVRRQRYCTFPAAPDVMAPCRPPAQDQCRARSSKVPTHGPKESSGRVTVPSQDGWPFKHILFNVKLPADTLHGTQRVGRQCVDTLPEICQRYHGRGGHKANENQSADIVLMEGDRTFSGAARVSPWGCPPR